MRKPRTLLRELAGRASVARLAARLGYPAKRVARWLKSGVPAGARADIERAHARSEKARAGWATRRLNAPREALGVGESSGATRDYLLALIADDDPAWLAHKKAFEEAGLSEHEAHERWHYPKPPRAKRQKIRRKSRKGKRKNKRKR